MSYIDCLPVRPPIVHLQTLSSLTADTLSANGYRNRAALQWLLGTRYIRRLLTDYPQSDEIIQSLSRSFFCEPEDLQATTFYYLLQKFGISETSNAVMFLNGNISSVLRYCGQCLWENPRFLL